MGILGDSSVKVPRSRLILWDIDGTIVKKIGESSYSIHRDALGLSPDSNNSNELTGLSDWDVLKHFAQDENVPFEKLDQAFIALGELQRSVPSKSFSTCLGMDSTLLDLCDKYWINGILTGNSKERAIAKLSSVGLIEKFSPKYFFCCEPNESRGQIALRAIESIKPHINEVIVIGDTPHDIHVGKIVSGRTVSVATGKYNLRGLKSYKPDLAIENFQKEKNKFLKYIKSGIN